MFRNVTFHSQNARQVLLGEADATDALPAFKHQ
jgi:hypothetical protein